MAANDFLTESGSSIRRSLVNCDTDLLTNFYQGRGWLVGWSTDGSPNNTRPLISNPIEGNTAKDSRLNGALGIIDLDRNGNFTRLGMESGLINSPYKLAATATEQDVERITKMLTTPRGVIWEAHNIEQETLQAHLDAQKFKRREDSVKYGRAALNVLQLTTDLLAQVAVTGLGGHTSPFSRRSYLKSEGGSVLGEFLGGFGETSNADLAQEGSPIGVSNIKYGLVKDDRQNARIKVSESRIGTGVSTRSLEENGELVDSDYSNIDVNYPNYPSIPDKEVQSRFISSTIEDPEPKPRPLKYDAKISFITGQSEYATGSEVKESESGNITGYKYDDGVVFSGTTSISEALKSGTYASTASGENGVGRIISGSPFYEIPGPQLEEEYNEYKASKLGLIPFAIANITPDDTEWLYFQANLESYSDNYTGNWEGTRYVGRAEQFYAYSGFDRKISFSFNALARTKDELQNLYLQLNHLAGLTAPSYDREGKFMRGTYTRITIGDLLQQQPGIITNIGLSWDKEVPWSIGTDTKGRPETIVVPHMLTVNVSFTPIHTFNITSRPKDSDLYFGLKSN